MPKREKTKEEKQASLARNIKNKVANGANPRHINTTKQESKLASRRKDYNTIKDTLGYHFPGSLQK